MITIAIVNQKGGEGKSTIANLLAHGLAKLNYKVLALDFDPQYTLSVLNEEEFNAKRSVSRWIQNVMEGITDDDPSKYISQARRIVDYDENENEVYENIENLYLAYGGRVGLANLSKILTDVETPEIYLSGILEQVDEEYDFCIVDTPGNDGVLLNNAMVAADYIVVPMLCSHVDIEASRVILQKYDQVRKSWNPDLKLAGILFNKTNSRSGIDKLVKEQAQEDLSDYRFFKTTIRECVDIRKMQINNVEIDKAKKALRNDVYAFIKELLKFIQEDIG